MALSQFTGNLGYNIPYGSIMAAGVITTIRCSSWCSSSSVASSPV